MYVKNLRLKNFRKFKKGYVKFNPEFMAITGKNASGKTQILDAIAIILGTVQSKLIQSEEAVQHLCNEDAHICTDKNFQDNAQYPVRVTANLEYKDTAYPLRRF